MSVRYAVQAAQAGTRTTILRLSGQLDAASAPRLVEQCRQTRESGRNLILNLSAVGFIASSGVGAILAIVEEYRQTPHHVCLAEVSPAVESVIRLLNLDQFLTLCASEDEALGRAEAA
jgi:anti-anti-sigma factor